MKKFSRSVTSMSLFQRALVYFSALVLSLFALRWLYVFLLTDYRSHQRPIIIPLALVTLAFSFVLFRLSLVAIVMLLTLVGVAGAGALYLQVSSAEVQPFLATVVVGSIFYLWVLGLPFARTPKSPQPATVDE
jgi:hypothetical protein